METSSSSFPNQTMSPKRSPNNEHRQQHPPLSPIRRPLSTYTTLGSPLPNGRTRSQSLGNTPVGWKGHCGMRTNFPTSEPLSQSLVMPSMMPPEPSATQKAMEAAAGLERERRKKMEVGEATMNADELRMVMKQERQRMTRAMADLAALKATNVQSQLEAEVVEEGRINGLMRRLDHLQQEKGRLIVELEREEEMVRYFYRITRW
jgi:hypothetical protein